jgi:protocatechuate 3,4-dioxygenase, beta subunit
MKHAVHAAALVAAKMMGCTRSGAQSAERAVVQPLPECEWCGAPEAPRELGNVLVIPTAGEEGEKLVVEGTVYAADGRTPAAGVLLYAYHTNARGVYPKRGDETGNGRRHGHVRGWLRTGADGRYRIETTRPGTYPSRDDPAHVHLTVREDGDAERSIEDIVFEDDPLVTPAYRARLRGLGGSGIVSPLRAADGSLLVRRDVFLGRR